jgi:molybdopterin-biosynthesis enzyme MoeA-like protein
MAGVPSIMQAMLENVTPRLKTGVKLQSVSVDSGGLPEGIYASGLGAIQKDHPDVIIGSYPHFDGQTFRNQIVLRGRDVSALERAKAAVEAMLRSLAENDKTIPL